MVKRRLIAGCINRYEAEEGWENVHVDASSRPLHDIATGQDVAPDIVADLTDLSMIDDDNFDEVRCWQTLEHLRQNDAFQALAEMHRVLKLGGVLDVEVPDVGRAAEWYVSGRIDERDLCQLLYGEQWDDVQDADLMVHRFGYVEQSLEIALREAAFVLGHRLDGPDSIVLRFRAVAA